MIKRSLQLLGAILVLSLFGAPASAQEGQEAVDLGPTGMLSLGKTYAFGGGADLQHGFGLDLRYALYPEEGADGYLGLFAAGEYQTGDAWRFAGGVTGGWDIVGVELGVAHRTETAGFAGSTGLHIAPSLRLGPLTLGGRLTIPLVDHASQNTMAPPAVQGFEAAVSLRLSFDFRVHGRQRQSGHGCHGQGGLRDPHADSHHGHGGH